MRGTCSLGLGPRHGRRQGALATAVAQLEHALIAEARMGGSRADWDHKAYRALSARGSAAHDLDLDTRRLEHFPGTSAADAPEVAAVVLRPDHVQAVG